MRSILFQLRLLPAKARRAFDAAIGPIDAAATALLTRSVRWPQAGAPSPAPPGPRRVLRVLLIRSTAIGDALVAFGALRAVAEQWPGSVTDIVGAEELREAARGLPYIGEIFVVRRNRRSTYFAAAAAVWKREPYDVVVDAHSPAGHLYLHTALMLAASRAPIRIGRSPTELGRAFTHLVPPAPAHGHLVEYMRSFFGPLISGSSPEDPAPRLALSDEERSWAARAWGAAAGDGPRVLINVATGHAWKRWSDDRFDAVARHVRARLPAAQIAIVGHGREEVAAAIAARVCGIQLRTSFRELIAVVASADLVITPDTAVSHVAAAFDRAVVSLHAVATESWRPYRARGRQLFSTSQLTLNFISVEAVTAAVDELLASDALTPLR